MKKLSQSLLLALSFSFATMLPTIAMATGERDLSTITGDAKRGEYLSILGDCQACHTNFAENGKPFAGGYAVSSPLGDIYSSNITPSKEYGIGNYTLAQFRDVLRKGIRADGEYLYPAMPYTAYTQLQDEDIADLYAYFMTAVTPVDIAPTYHTDLPFPFDKRSMMIVWNGLFLDPGPFKPDPSASEEWNRGAYIVEALAHCSTCHTPRDVMMGEKKDQYLAGGALGSWYAPNITSSINAGIGNWSQEDLVTYLREGLLEGKAQAGGPMAEAVSDSFQHLRSEDLQAIATYIRSVKPIDNSEQKAPRDSYGAPFDVDLLLRGTEPVDANHTLKSGESLYSAYCSSCHQNDGSGTPEQFYPSLYHNTATGDYNPSNAIAAILNGVDRKVGETRYYMPNFGVNSPTQALDDTQIARIVQFVYEKYGNQSVKITPEMVREVRLGGPAPLLLKAQPFMLPGMAIGGVILLLLIIWGVVHFRRKGART
ncbi:cytochrome c [Ignatzschineria cameli]|uniref:Cytochrome C n=1 Tax=Ignatzschineria cameli TaxID=2182793 RepID=A0ABX5L3S3_9GAMM|nr:cytochrome c [Ignatzschineria cameli]PWD89913.1 cytochrome C [Ignatzschineria cameli]PWD91563.1 cytochrome C [Ignatzschineria cameli]PWD92600.1 cytochrome C [Ignatzschineria cameli]